MSDDTKSTAALFEDWWKHSAGDAVGSNKSTERMAFKAGHQAALTAHADYHKGEVAGVKEEILNRLHRSCGHSSGGKNSVLPHSILASTVLKAIDLDGKFQASERGDS